MQNQNPYEPPSANPNNLANKNMDRAQLQKVAKGQRLVIYAFLAYIVLVFANNVIMTQLGLLGVILMPIAMLVLLGISLWGIILLTINMNYHIVITILVALLMFVPLLNLITLLIVNSKATGVLRKGGYTLGFFGARE